MNITSITKCIEDVNKQFNYETIKILVLQTEEHKYDLEDFTQMILNYLNINNIRKKIYIERRLLSLVNNNATITNNIDYIEIHLIIAWNEETLNTFLEANYKIIIPLARNIYEIVFLTSTSQWSNIITRFRNDFSVVDTYLCSRTNHNSINLQNDRFPLKVTIFSRYPTSITEIPKLMSENPIYKSFKLFGGIDGFLLSTIVEHFNFDIDRVDDCKKSEIFGEVLPNGTITGSLGIIANNEAHISFNGRFLMDYGTDNIEFTAPYDTDRICVGVPKSERVPQWLIFVYCFDLLTWFIICVVFFICYYFWYYIGPHQKRCIVFWQIFNIFLGIPTRFRPTLKQIFFLFSCMVFNIIILSVVQGQLIKAFTTPTYYKEINTLVELDKANFPIATNFYSFDNDSKIHRNLKRKQFGTIAFSNVFNFIAYSKNLSKIERERDFSFFIRVNYVNEDGTPRIHIMSECLASYLISYIVPKGSALLNAFNKVILRLVQSGLTLKWYNDVEFSIVLEKLMKLYGIKTLWRPFSLYNIQSAFFIWLLGTGFSIFVFVVETLFRKKFYKCFN